MWDAKQLLVVQRRLDLSLVPGPVSYLCPGLDPRPHQLLCMGDWVMGLALLWEQKDHAEGPGSLGRITLSLLQTSPGGHLAWAPQLWGKRIPVS